MSAKREAYDTLYQAGLKIAQSSEALQLGRAIVQGATSVATTVGAVAVGSGTVATVGSAVAGAATTVGTAAIAVVSSPVVITIGAVAGIYALGKWLSSDD